MRVLKIRNISGNDDVYSGQVIKDGYEYTVCEIERDVFATDTKVLQQLSDGYIIVSYNDTDLSPTDGKDALDGVYPRVIKVTSDDTNPGYLSEKIIAGHNIDFTIRHKGENEEIHIFNPLRLDGYAQSINNITNSLDAYGSFGNDFQYAQSTRDSETTSRSWQDKVSLTSGACTGDYLVLWRGTVQTDGHVGQYRLQNTTDDISYDIHEEKRSGDSPQDVWMSIGGFEKIRLSGSAKTFKVQWRNKSGAHTAKIRDVKLMIWKAS
jgi:hypothetical protein